jgi:hypothetical protein
MSHGFREVRAALVAVGVVVAMAALATHAQSGRLDPGAGTYATYALSADASSLTDRELAVNRRWVGTTGEELAELVRVDTAQRFARVRFRSVDLEVSAPLGWHAIEDAERAAVFTPDGSVRMIFWRVDLAFEGVANLEGYVAAKQDAIKARLPSVRTRAYRTDDGAWVIAYGDVPARSGDREKRAIYDLVVPNPRSPKHALLVTLGAPASRGEEFLPLLALVARDVRPNWRSDR